jgi:acyl-CoA synthetase (AMP-forming)/AMP-acid ligase II
VPGCAPGSGGECLRQAEPPEVAVVLFTSGSETVPKAVPLTHRNILTNIADCFALFRARPDDSILGILPPFHSFGLMTSVVLPLTLGCRVVHHPNPTDGAALGQTIDAYKPTLLMGTPTFLRGIVRASTKGQLASLRLVVSGAEKCGERVYRALAESCPQTVVLEGYGVTECSPVVAGNFESDARPGTIGRPVASVEVALVSPATGGRVEPGHDGVLLVRGPSLFGGYLNYDGPSPFVEFEGKSWYRTGDLIREAPDGWLTFAGRLQRFVKLGGEMVSLPAIEAALEPRLVSDDDKGPSFAVAATPVEESPEIVLFSTKGIEREEANSIIRAAGLSGLHNIRRVIRVDELPLLGTGKTDYRGLADRLRIKT